MGHYATHLAGREYADLGTILESRPEVHATGYHVNRKGQRHGLQRAITREVTPADRMHALREPVVVFDQRGQGYAFLSERAFIAITYGGAIKTVYGREDFDPTIRRILADAGAGW